jgi:hypothetical protein
VNGTHAAIGARAKLIEICHRFPEVTSEGDQHIAFFVRKKKFAYYLEDHHDDGRVALVCKAETGENTALIASDPARFFMPAYIGPRGWVGFWLDLPAVDWDEAEELLADSYRLTAPKQVWREFQERDR